MRHKIYSLEPQRRIAPGDGGWTLCTTDEAERFAIVQLTVVRKGKRTFRTHRVLDHYTSEAKARQVLARYLRKS